MKKKFVAMLMCMTMVSGLLAGCGSSSGSGAGGVAASDGYGTLELTDEEQEAVDAGLINLDGTLPIITDPEAFAEKYGKISMLFVNSADRVEDVDKLAMVQKWYEDTGIEFDWQTIPSEGAQEKINLMLASGDELPDAFWNSDIVDRYINQWVTGGVTDENWQAYLDELQAAGVEELVSIYQAAVDRSTK